MSDIIIPGARERLIIGNNMKIVHRMHLMGSEKEAACNINTQNASGPFKVLYSKGGKLTQFSSVTITEVSNDHETDRQGSTEQEQGVCGARLYSRDRWSGFLVYLKSMDESLRIRNIEQRLRMDHCVQAVSLRTCLILRLPKSIL